MNRWPAILILGAAVCGCATPSSERSPVIWLKNDQTGQLARCGGGIGGFVGGGAIGQDLERRADQLCASDWEGKGFKRI